MDDFPRSTVAVRELSNTSQRSSTTMPRHAPPSPSSSLSQTSSESSRHSCEAPGSPTTHTRDPANFKPMTAFDPDAPPPYREEDFQGKSKDEVSKMRKRDYAVQISRMMGRQLVRGMKGEGGEK
ncbi:hypothetical protein P171DRAFT_521309 [Karstenula rhodostoma CBS 690.94]|uniref:Uncharacterized protein n=1 Tax=Karstenula rhodostoma CBS 690.94 TaxID=1392251 RepID=A0A9P4UDE9_9PLEO|nr:hypothetical protein P171DRAFT_521309 [Karstenula rhodostoma CBS 690.94]